MDKAFLVSVCEQDGQADNGPRDTNGKKAKRREEEKPNACISCPGLSVWSSGVESPTMPSMHMKKQQNKAIPGQKALVAQPQERPLGDLLHPCNIIDLSGELSFPILLLMCPHPFFRIHVNAK